MHGVSLAHALLLIIASPLLPSLPSHPDIRLKQREYGRQHHEKQQEIQLNRNCVAFFIVFIVLVIFVVFVVFVVFVIKFIPQCHSWVNLNASAVIGGYSESNPVLVTDILELWVATAAKVGELTIYFALVSKNMKKLIKLKLS